jgi:hypothetical protein
MAASRLVEVSDKEIREIKNKFSPKKHSDKSLVKNTNHRA